MRHSKFLQIAESFANKSNYERWPVGAVLVRGGRILGGAANDLRNPASMVGVPFEECSIHAEMAALRKVRKAHGTTIYVARVLRTGDLGLAKPCLRCQQDLINAGVRQAIWTIDGTSYGTTTFRGNNHGRTR